MKNVPYVYKNCPIPGGGYVTGFLFNPSKKNVMYIRTDIGGTYRFNAESDRFESLIDHVGMEDISETFPIAIATDPDTPESLYVAAGTGHGENGRFLVSKDGGKSFVTGMLPIPAHGNWNGRGTGDRLIYDPEKKVLYFASPRNGLWKSPDEGLNWTEIDVCGEKHFTMVFKRPGTDTLVVGTAGVTTKTDDMHRGHSLYISYDGGGHFEPVQMPEVKDMPKSRMSGLVAHRYAYDGKYLYVTANHTGEWAYIVEPGYSCDCGQVIGGVVLRYSFDDKGKISGFENIAPEKDHLKLRNGYGGISSTPEQEGLLVLSTITKDDGDVIYRSYDYGTTWEKILEGLTTGKIRFKTPYMDPKYNGNGSIIHWLSDIKFDPFDKNKVWFNTGTGVFSTENFTDAVPVFHDHTDGIEETVHLNLYSPTGTDVKLIDILGDLGGFAFRDLDKPCENSFSDAEGNRYITCINADYSDTKPECVIVTPRGNWRGKTKGGLIFSNDACKNFDRIPLPFGMTEELDERFADIERPNVNAGWVALSADAGTIVWSVAKGIELPKELVIVSHDRGKNWQRVKIGTGTEKDRLFKVYSDRVDPEVFYGFTEKGNVYLSRDGGSSFAKIDTEGSFEGVNFGLIDCANKTEIRVESGHEGSIYIAAAEHGLFRLFIDTEKASAKVIRLSEDGDYVYRLGLGIIRPGADYFTENKALYVSAVIGGKYGFYRSFDDGKTWEKINDDAHKFGEINSIDADKRTFGRFYIASGSRGVLYGDETTI